MNAHRIARQWRNALIALAILGAFGLVGGMDAADQAEYHQHTCDMIAAGHWPIDVAPTCGD